MLFKEGEIIELSMKSCVIYSVLNKSIVSLRFFGRTMP